MATSLDEFRWKELPGVDFSSPHQVERLFESLGRVLEDLSDRINDLESMLRTHVHPNPNHVSGVPGNPHMQAVRSVPPTLPATFPTEEP